MEDFAIEFDQVTKLYGEHKVLNNMTFKIHRGKITTILGFSGAGKSTLMKHVLGLTHPTSGQITVLKENLTSMNDLQLREFRRHFGMVFQYAALFDFLTTFENVAFPLREFTKLTEKEIKNKVMNLLESVGIGPEATFRLPSELSGGMRKRVGLARALALEPEIMLYDEPTSGLDPITTQMVNQLIFDTAFRNKERAFTSVIISHDIHATLKISDYVIFLERGQIVEHSSVEEFKKTANPVIRRFLEL
jgi:phospholipid/cholesterol/gamma-HCH transport system ATP-binding protein